MSISRFLRIIILMMLLSLTACSSSKPPDGASQSAGSKKYSKPPAMMIDINRKYIATITLAKGDLVVELFPKDAPKTVNSFVFLAREGFYDGTTFHRVIPGFMAQGGDPTGTGSGGPGYVFEDEKNDRKVITGIIAMANSGPNTNGSQFFITYSPQHHLDGLHTVFGQLTQGFSVLNRLTPRDPLKDPSVNGDTIIKISITESQ